ncbi:hypothetical protein D3C73_845370 [compost metagenome]
MLVAAGRSAPLMLVEADCSALLTLAAAEPRGPPAPAGRPASPASGDCPAAYAARPSAATGSARTSSSLQRYTCRVHTIWLNVCSAAIQCSSGRAGIPACLRDRRSRSSAAASGSSAPPLPPSAGGAGQCGSSHMRARSPLTGRCRMSTRPACSPRPSTRAASRSSGRGGFALVLTGSEVSQPASLAAQCSITGHGRQRGDFGVQTSAPSSISA